METQKGKLKVVGQLKVGGCSLLHYAQVSNSQNVPPSCTSIPVCQPRVAKGGLFHLLTLCQFVTTARWELTLRCAASYPRAPPITPECSCHSISISRELQAGRDDSRQQKSLRRLRSQPAFRKPCHRKRRRNGRVKRVKRLFFLFSMSQTQESRAIISS